ncbi:hypothetical protein DPX16_16578 [Anabarilius grahami]|nr:hypothetical protein DPX16_16578 [Anabarilius grahami]
MEAQDRHKDPDTEESQKKIHKLQKALIAAQQREQLEKAARENLEKELFHKESLLKTANSERLDKDARIRACERHLDNTKDELDMAQRELRLSYLQQTEPLQEKHLTSPHGVSIRTSPSQAQRYQGGSQSLLLDTISDNFLKSSAAAEGEGLIQTDPETSCEVAFKDLQRIAKHIPAFTPELAGDHDVHGYLRDIDFHLQYLTSATHQDRLFLLWITSGPEVRRFLARQPENIQSDYRQLKQAIVKEFSDSESESGLIAALDTKQGRHEIPYAYYHRLRQAYFGARNEPGMEEDTSFKSLFLRNLHPIVSHHLGITACPRTMPIRQLRDLTQKAFNKHLASSKRVCNTQGTVNCKAQDPELAKEGAQHCYNAKPFSKRLLASQGQNCPHGNRPRYQTYHRKKPWMGASSSCRPRRTSNSRQQPPLPPRPSHSSHTDAAQGRMDTPASDPQELLMLVKELLEQFLPEKYSEAQDSDHSHNTTQPCSSQPRHKSRVTLQTSDCF